MDKKHIAQAAAKILLDTKSVLFNIDTPFQYTSGNTGPVYVDCRRLISFPDERKTAIDLAAQLLESRIKESNIDVIAGGETAGIPYAAFLAARLEKPMVYVRKKPKGVGRMAQIEGNLDETTNPQVLLVEDLQNFGHSKSIFVDALRQAGAKVEHFFTIFDYGIRGDVEQINKDLGITGHHLCNWWDVLDVAKEQGYFDGATLDSVEAFLNNPEKWAA